MQRPSVDTRRTSATVKAGLKKSSRTSIDVDKQQQQMTPSRASNKPPSVTKDAVSSSKPIKTKHRRLTSRMSEASKERHARRAIRLANTTEKVAKNVAKVPTVAGGIAGGIILGGGLGWVVHDDDDAFDSLLRGSFAIGGAIVGGAAYAATETMAQATMLPAAASIGKRWLNKHGKEPEPSSYGPVPTIKSASRNRARYAKTFIGANLKEAEPSR